ncbi:hypothetical protein ABFY47_24615 [Enterobacter ludwigii]|jgi:hypothetical protein|uniref:hypothetical protein n=1 Tax=Enterobacter ludwigii TaxID=299767 RepID=UPI003D1A32A4
MKTSIINGSEVSRLSVAIHCRSSHDIHPSVLDDDKKLTPIRYNANLRVGNNLAPFELALESVNASVNPLSIVTPVVQGKLQYHIQHPIDEQLRNEHTPNYHIEGVLDIPDYLNKYFKEGGFHLKKLINDDHMEPVKLLFNQKHYISSFKLLVSLIDTIAYLEYGDVKMNFQQWLDTYSEISKLETTSDEIYQLRNFLLHTTNLNSRDVLKKKHRRLSTAICKKGHPTQ